MEWQKEGFTISTDKHKLELAYIHHYLSKESYWAEAIPIEIVQQSINNSVCFGVYNQEKQIGFARVITDEATFGYLADVFIDTAFRGKGLSKWLMQIIMAYPAFQNLRRIMLVTKDAQGLYEQFGFTYPNNVQEVMYVRRPDIYKQWHKDTKQTS